MQAWTATAGGGGGPEKGTFIHDGGNRQAVRIFPMSEMTTLGIGKAGGRTTGLARRTRCSGRKGARCVCFRTGPRLALRVTGRLEALGLAGSLVLERCRGSDIAFSLTMASSVVDSSSRTERNADGVPIGPSPNGDDHARMYRHLVEGSDGVPHYVSFLNGKYHNF